MKIKVNIKSKILIVDDSPLSILITKGLLGSNYIVKTASDGEQALKLTEFFKPDLILLDIIMPGISGLEVCKTLSNDEKYSDIPIIMVTSLSDINYIKEGLEAGAVDYITKPFSQTELSARINSALRLRHYIKLLKQTNLEEQKLIDELRKASEIIEEKNQQILSSIHYAERIQNSILTIDEKIKSTLPEYFIIFMPKEIISGDFYWFAQVKDKIFIAVVDCTGHGVPGALLSMIGNMFLNEIVYERHVFEPASILEHLHHGIRARLKQENGSLNSTDGMDVGLCRIDWKKKKMTFAGAKRPLYCVTDSKLIEFKGDRKMVGGRQKEEKRKFTNHKIDIQSGDMIYLTSDGISDQHNSESTKYSSIRLKQFLQKISNQNCSKQKEALLRELKNHQGKEEQRDDITIMGVRMTFNS